MTARFKNATTTSSALNLLSPISSTSVVAGISVMVNSRSVRRPLARGISSTFFWSGGGSLSSGRSHCLGRELWRMSWALRAWSCQGWRDIFNTYLVRLESGSGGNVLQLGSNSLICLGIGTAYYAGKDAFPLTQRYLHRCLEIVISACPRVSNENELAYLCLLLIWLHV